MSGPLGFCFMAPVPRLDKGARDWQDRLRRIEDLGFHSVAISEHFSQGWAMDALTAMAFAAAATSRLRCTSLVLNSDLHHPAMLAKAIATADVLSGGRVTLGLGAGWLRDDYHALGSQFQPASVRLTRMEEALQVVKQFFEQDQVTFRGQHYQLADLQALPRPVQRPRPPILVGGGGPRLLTIAARYADIVGIQATRGPAGLSQKAARNLSRAGLAAKIDLVREASAAAGRRMPQLQFTCYDVNVGGVQVTGDRTAFSSYLQAYPEDFAGSPVSLRGDVAQCVDSLVRWREELGITHWNLGPDIETLAPVVARLSSE